MTPSCLGLLAWFRLHFTCSSSLFWACLQLERICHAQGGLMEGEAVESGPVVEHVADLSTLRMKTWKHILSRLTERLRLRSFSDPWSGHGPRRSGPCPRRGPRRSKKARNGRQRLAPGKRMRASASMRAARGWWVHEFIGRATRVASRRRSAEAEITRGMPRFFSASKTRRLIATPTARPLSL